MAKLGGEQGDHNTWAAYITATSESNDKQVRDMLSRGKLRVVDTRGTCMITAQLTERSTMHHQEVGGLHNHSRTASTPIQLHPCVLATHEQGRLDQRA